MKSVSEFGLYAVRMSADYYRLGWKAFVPQVLLLFLVEFMSRKLRFAVIANK